SWLLVEASLTIGTTFKISAGVKVVEGAAFSTTTGGVALVFFFLLDLGAPLAVGCLSPDSESLLFSTGAGVAKLYSRATSWKPSLREISRSRRMCLICLTQSSGSS